MNIRKKISWIVILSLMGSIPLFSCTNRESSEEKAPADAAEVVKNKEAEKSIAESPSQIPAREKITGINPSKIHIDSEGHIVTKDISYEEMRQLAEILTELGESGEIRFSREYEEVKDNRGRTISKSENGFTTTYEYPKNPYIPFATSSKTVKEKGNKEKQGEK